MLGCQLGCATLVAALSVALAAQDGPHAIVGPRIIPIVGAEIADGVLLWRDGKILALGSREDVVIPPGTDVLEADGILMPGLVDTHSHIGGPSGGDRSGPLHPDARALDAIDVLDPGFEKARAGGITTVNVMPGSGHLMSGQTVYLKLRDGITIEDLEIRDADGRPMGGMKMANGTNPRGDPPFPGTRGRAAAAVRELFVRALEYRRKLEAAADDPSKRPARDLGLEALLEVLDGKRIVHHHTHRHDDIITVLRLVREFGFRVVLHHVSEGWKVAEQIAAAGVGVSAIMIDSPGGKLEAVDLRPEIGAILERAGVPVAFHTDDGITDSRLFLRSAALAVRAGMSRQGALESLTIAGARMLDLGDRVGSLEPGKDADFILLSGDPFSVYTQVLGTWVEGKRVFDRSDPRDRLYAEGGWGASRGQSIHVHGERDE